MLDSFERKIDYMRISVIDRCNQKCVYCMPPEGVILKPRDQILSFEQIESVVSAAVQLGIRRVRLTGGEPLIRRDIEKLVKAIHQIPGIEDLAMSTNGILLADKAELLKQSGLDRVNISIDSLDPLKYSEITRGGHLEDAISGLDAAIKADLAPVKVNMVVFSDTSDSEIDDMHEFCSKKGAILQTIKQFSLYDHKHAGAAANADRPPKCSECNRIRLTSDGYLKPCLFSEGEIKVDFDNIKASILKAVQEKPESGNICRNRGMNEIGG